MGDRYAYDEAKMREGIADYLRERMCCEHGFDLARVRQGTAGYLRDLVRKAGIPKAPRPLKPLRKYDVTTTRLIVSEVARAFALKEEQLHLRTKAKRIVGPRQVAMYLMRHRTQATLEQIGLVFGVGFKTVEASLMRVESRVAGDEELRQAVNLLKEKLVRRGVWRPIQKRRRRTFSTGLEKIYLPTATRVL